MGQKYPILTTYQEEVDVDKYIIKIKELLESQKIRYGYNDLDAMLVLKDILSRTWNSKEQQ